MPNERRDQMHPFDIYLFTFCENHTCQNLSQNDAITFFTDFCTTIKYKWPNFLYLKFLFQLNLFVGCYLA